MAKKVESTEKFKTMIGGQALIEGIMMLGPDKSSVVVRKKDGLRIKTEPRKVSEGFSLKKLPLIRGVFNFCASMKMGVTALLYSADVYAEDDEEAAQEPQSRLDAWLEKHLSSEKAQSVMTTLAVVVGIAFSVALFFVLPSLIGSVINRFLTTNELVRNLLEGLVRIVIFLTYMFLVSRMKDMKRVFAYHGAEHKTIRCYEAQLPQADPPAPALRHELPVRGHHHLHSRLLRRDAAPCAGHAGISQPRSRGAVPRGAAAAAPADRGGHQL